MEKAKKIINSYLILIIYWEEIINMIKQKMKNIILLTCGVACAFLMGWFGSSFFTSKKIPNEKSTVSGNYNGYEVNGVLRYGNIGVLIVNHENIDSIKSALKKGRINFNGKIYDFVNLNKKVGCNEVEINSVLHYTFYDKAVLFKSASCIPDNEKIIPFAK